MRTGSPRNARFKGKHKLEYAWFAISGSLPLLSIDAERAARQIIRAARRGAARLVLGLHARGAVLLSELFPALTSCLLSNVHRLLPRAEPGRTSEHHAGFESESMLAPGWLTQLSRLAAARNNEIP
jgi:hypothetical protein